LSWHHWYSTDALKKTNCTFDVGGLDAALQTSFTYEFDIRDLVGTELRFGFGLSPISPRNGINTEGYFYFTGWGTSTAKLFGDFNTTVITIASFDMSSYDTSSWITVKLEYDEPNSGKFRLYLNGTAIGSGVSSTWSAHTGFTNVVVGYRPLQTYDSWVNNFDLKQVKFNGTIVGGG
jgi:hypothetical protein